ncbi:hypothetical protein N7508_006236 [Penicillium antarcticum]|uniref:uncharacterized protein n=1 Tax=Penicillium antarcticum TaxID=416450 RepID=UPI00238807FA|nr:uncharacterized protein N7508_006236 [Penicillium antarcticum]KAJ5301373.1 hypothetical protein N7508_006236 [Penicillium antarcticum]
MSGMKLRDNIRAPTRYGEGEGPEIPTPRSALRMRLDEGDDDNMELSDLGRPRPVKKRSSTSKPFNPNLPPAAFPSLDRPQTNPQLRRLILNLPVGKRQSGFRLPPAPTSDPSSAAAAIADMPRQRRRVKWAPTTVDHVPLDSLENHVVSNNESNPVYVRNMAMMAKAALRDPMDTSDEEQDMSMSDNEDLPDPTQLLLDKIPNPKWSELNSALQVEMVDRAMRNMTWRTVCTKLKLGPRDHQKLSDYMDTRNKQIERENKRMEEMRNKQRAVLMNIDNSDTKLFAPPPQLVLQRIMRQVTRESLLDGTNYTDLMLCTSGDVLAARQYLHQHGFPRSWAGDWGDGMVELHESADDCQDPDEFHWKDNLTVTAPFDGSKHLVSPAVQDRTEFIHDVGLSSSRLIDPRALIRNSADADPTQDWRRYFDHWYPDPQDLTGTSPESSRTTTRHQGIVNLKVGRQKAAQIQQYERTGTKPYGWPAYGPRPSPITQSAEIETPTRVCHNPVGPQFSPQSNTPVTRQQNLQYTPQPPIPFSRRIPVIQPNSPFSRSVGGNWLSRDVNYAESQARFAQRLQQAHLSMTERQGRTQTQYYDLQPRPHPSGVSTGGSPYSRTQPYAAVQNIVNTQRMTGRAIPQTNQYDAFLHEHQRSRGMGDGAGGSMDGLVYSDLSIMLEESEDEHMEPPKKREEEQSSSTDLSLGLDTDDSANEMVMVPTDSCASSRSRG